MSNLTEKLTTQNVLIGLLTLAVIYLMYVNYNKSCDEKYSNNISKYQTIGTVTTKFAADQPGEKYVTTDANGNLSISNKLVLNTGGNVETNTLFTSTNGGNITGNLSVSGTVGNRRVLIANAFSDLTSTLTSGINWITVDGILKLKYSTGKNTLIPTPLTSTPSYSVTERAGVVMFPITTTTTSYRPCSAMSLISLLTTSTNTSGWSNTPGIGFTLWTYSQTPTTLTTNNNLRPNESRNSAGDTWEMLVTCAQTQTTPTTTTTTTTTTTASAASAQVCNIYKIYCQVLKTWSFTPNVPSVPSPQSDAVVFIIEKIYPNELITIT